MLETLFNSRLRAKTITFLMTHADDRFFVRQLNLLIGEDSTNLSRELARLTRMGILICHIEGRQKYFQANKRCPVYEELKGLVLKTSGIADMVKKALLPIVGRLRIAFIFGSIAEGTETSESDIDLFMIGEITLRDTAPFLVSVSSDLGRVINPVIFSPVEMKEAVEEKRHFIMALLDRKKLFLIGDEDEFEQLFR